jgi:hypothetical protein
MGGYRIGQFVLYEKDFGWMALWDLDPEMLGSLWLKTSVRREGELCHF